MASVLLHRTDPARNMKRFYRLSLDRDLFGYWLLLHEWGRIGRPGQMRLRSFPTADEAINAQDRQRRAKERRGYQAVPI